MKLVCCVMSGFIRSRLCRSPWLLSMVLAFCCMSAAFGPSAMKFSTHTAVSLPTCRMYSMAATLASHLIGDWWSES